MKHRIAVASIMGFLTTGIITFVLVTINLGFNQRFIINWCRSWIIAYVIIVPLIFLIGPRVQQFVSCLQETMRGRIKSTSNQSRYLP